MVHCQDALATLSAVMHIQLVLGALNLDALAERAFHILAVLQFHLRLNFQTTRILGDLADFAVDPVELSLFSEVPGLDDSRITLSSSVVAEPGDDSEYGLSGKDELVLVRAEVTLGPV